MKNYFKKILLMLLANTTNIAAKPSHRHFWTDDALLEIMDRRALGNRLVEYIRMNNLPAIGNILSSPHLQARPIDFNTVRQGLLFNGARYNRPEVISLGLLMDADINYRDQNGQTALAYAIAHGNRESIQILLANHAASTWLQYMRIIELGIPRSALLAASFLAGLALFEYGKATARRTPNPDLPPRARL